jgi:hypothetical protein
MTLQTHVKCFVARNKSRLVGSSLPDLLAGREKRKTPRPIDRKLRSAGESHLGISGGQKVEKGVNNYRPPYLAINPLHDKAPAR